MTSRRAITLVGEPKDGDYLAKVVVHELAHVYVHRILATKGDGWRNGAPAWFVEGYAEHLGTTLTTRKNRAVVLRKYVERTKLAPERIRVDAAIQVENDYAKGATFCAFLSEAFGRSAPRDLLSSRATSFDDAFTGVHGTDRSAVAAELRAWLSGSSERPLRRRTWGQIRVAIPNPTSSAEPTMEAFLPDQS